MITTLYRGSATTSSSLRGGRSKRGVVDVRAPNPPTRLGIPSAQPMNPRASLVMMMIMAMVVPLSNGR
jgi:hypothetical protein